MDWLGFFAAVALFLVFEGIMPFLSPRRYRLMCMKLIVMKEKEMRLMGLISMIVGVIILWVIKQL